MTDPTAEVLSQSIELQLTGQPDCKNKYGTGHIRPERVVFYYLEGRINAHLFGSWVREDGEATDHPVDQLYRGTDNDWPDWLTAMAQEHDPGAAIDRLREQHAASLQHADEVNNQLMEEVQRYAAGTERPVLWSVYNEMHKRAITAEHRAAAMEHAMQSTATSALQHSGCHSKLMTQCQRAEKAEAERDQLRAAPALLRRVADLVTERTSDLWAPGTVAHSEMLADAEELRRLAAEAPAPETQIEYTESVLYEVVGNWGVDGADSAAEARAAVAKWLKAYPTSGAHAQQRITREWPDGSEWYGPWTDLPDTEEA